MKNTSSLVRQWQLLASLSSRPAGCTLADFAREHDVGVKTIRRDLADLRKAGFPLQETLGDHGRQHWTLAPLASLPSLSLNWMEAISLYLCRRFMEPLSGTHFGISAGVAFRKIRSTLGDLPLRYLDRMSRAYHVTIAGQVDYAAKAELIDQLTTAIEERRITQLVYRSERSTEPVSRDVHPLAWVFHNASAYLVANAPDHGEIRLYKLNRMESAYVIDLKFTKPADFSVSEFLAGALGVYRGGNGEPLTVRVRFHAAIARFAGEKRWHASQTLSPQPDGSLIAEFRLTSLVEIKSWLLSWGRQVEVLEPAALADEMRAEAESIVGLYSPQKSRRAVVEAPSPPAGRADVEAVEKEPGGARTEPRKPRSNSAKLRKPRPR